MSEVAFVVMDLADRGRPDLAHRFLDAYLARTGDYAGLAVLPFYLTYRAMVRAKIARLRASQLAKGAAQEAAVEESRGYLRLARRHTAAPRPALIITCGLSGTGKTAISQALLEAIGGVRVRSDVERKRLHGIAALARSDAPARSGLYSTAASAETYEHLHALARDIVGTGRIAIVDATFLRRAQRDSFRALATEQGVPFAIVAFEAKEATLRARIVERQAGGRDASDADLAVLARQKAGAEPLTVDERAFAVTYDAEAPLEAARAPSAWSGLTDLLARQVKSQQ
jgi:predicted kinase